MIRLNSWSNSINSFSFYYGVLIICGIAIFLIEQVRWDLFLRTRLQWMTVPVSQMIARGVELTTHPAYSLSVYFSDATELDRLRTQHAQDLVTIAELEYLKEENEILKRMLQGESNTHQSKMIAAPITSYAYPAIGIGSSAGVREGQVVVAHQTLLGKITEVESDQSRVQLLFNLDSQPILAETTSGVQGLIKGTGKKVMLTEVLPDSQLTIGDKVITSGQPGIKQGLLVGVIVAVTPPSSTPTQMAEIDQLVSFYTTPLVEVR